MKRIVSYIICMLLCLSLSGQSRDLILNLLTDSEIRGCDSLGIELVLQNPTNLSKQYLKPDIELVKYGLMAIILRDDKSEQKYVYYLGDGGDIDEIVLTCENSVMLDNQESFIKTLNIGLEDFSPALNKSGTYTLMLIIDYSIVDFKSNFCPIENIFTGKLTETIKNIKIK